MEGHNIFSVTYLFKEQFLSAPLSGGAQQEIFRALRAGQVPHCQRYLSIND